MPRMLYGERLASVETELKAVRAEVGEMRTDVKALLAAHNRQQGYVIVGKIVWGGLCAGLALAGEWVINQYGQLPPPGPHP